MVVSLKKRKSNGGMGIKNHDGEVEPRRRHSMAIPNMTGEAVQMIKRAFWNSKHESLSFNEMSIMLLKLRNLLSLPFDDRIPEIYHRFIKKYMGPAIRDLDAGSIFGERALEGESLRTASVISLTPCDVIVLGVVEYNSLVKSAANTKQMDKVRMIHNTFRGSDRLDFELFWQFQYQFTVYEYFT